MALRSRVTFLCWVVTVQLLPCSWHQHALLGRTEDQVLLLKVSMVIDASRLARQMRLSARASWD